MCESKCRADTYIQYDGGIFTEAVTVRRMTKCSYIRITLPTLKKHIDHIN